MNKKYICNIQLLIILSWIKITHTADPLKCYSCNSIENLSCVVLPGPEFVKECEEDDAVCVIFLDNSTTIRDCTSSDKIFKGENYKCNEDFCNGIVDFPLNRLKCYHCDGTDCVKEKSGNLHNCPKYKENDECFVVVIDEIDAIRGCISNLNGNPMNTVKCKGNGCNDKSGVSKHKCVDCNSKEDFECIRRQDGSEGNIIVDKVCLVDVLYGHLEEPCFTYHKYGEVIRGCSKNAGKLAIETAEFFNTCPQNECNNLPIPHQKCVVCTGDDNDPVCRENEIQNCELNTTMCHSCWMKDGFLKRGCGDVKPENGECNKCQNKDGCNDQYILGCKTCSSEFDINCMGYYGPIREVLCESADTKCISLINEKRYFERGCVSRNLTCTDSKETYCLECKGNNCNNDKLAQSRILSCHQCANTKDCSTFLPVELARPCEKWKNNNICYEYLEDGGKNIVRGCSSDNKYKTCIKMGARCKKCNGLGCNNNLSILKKPSLSCIKCNSVLDPTCQWTQNKYSKTICKEYPLNGTTEYCYSFKKNSFVQRGCVLDDKICSENSENCNICSVDGCNTELLIPQICVQGTINDDNYNITLKKLKCTADKQYDNTQGCYTQRTGSNVTWGCAVDLPTEQLIQCKDKNYKMCSFCKGEYCNQMQAPKNGTNLQCYKCNSVFNHDCVLNPGKNLPVELCTGNQTECVTAVFKNFSYRECRAPAHTKSIDRSPAFEVVTCSEHLCNGEIIPKNRLLCHQCNGADECSTKYSRHEAKPCFKYMTNDECFEYVTYDKKVARGCKSDIQEYKKCLVEDSCKKCSTNGCNNYFATLTKPTLSCIKCNNLLSSKCQWTQNNVEIEKCTNYGKIDVQEYCYSFKNSSDYVQRGCLNDEVICESNDPYCQLCNEPGCNRGLLIFQVCSQGNSSTVNIPTRKICNATIQTYENQGCYVKKTDTSSFIWGCAADLILPELIRCKAPDNNICNYCSGKDCANLKVPSSKETNNNNGSTSNYTHQILYFLILAIILKPINSR